MTVRIALTMRQAERLLEFVSGALDDPLLDAIHPKLEAAIERAKPPAPLPGQSTIEEFTDG